MLPFADFLSCEDQHSQENFIHLIRQEVFHSFQHVYFALIGAEKQNSIRWIFRKGLCTSNVTEENYMINFRYITFHPFSAQVGFVQEIKKTHPLLVLIWLLLKPRYVREHSHRTSETDFYSTTLLLKNGYESGRVRLYTLFCVQGTACLRTRV